MPTAEATTETPSTTTPAAAGAAAAAAAVTEKTFAQSEVARLLADAKREAKEKGGASARADLIASLKDFGIADEESLKAALKSADDARKAQLSDQQRQAEELKKTAADLAAARAEAASARAEAAKARVIAEARPADVELFEALYDRAAAAKDFDPKAWIEEQKGKRPALFAATAAGQPGVKLAPTTIPTIPGGAPPARSNGAAAAFDALKASPEELAAYERSLGIAPAR